MGDSGTCLRPDRLHGRQVGPDRQDRGGTEPLLDPFWIHILAGVLMAAVGLRMLLQAFQKKTLLEHRMETVDIKADTVLSLRLCIQAMLLGISCGLLRLPVHILLISVFGFSAIFAGIGYVSGRANGALFTDQATGIGGALLCMLGIVLQIA